MILVVSECPFLLILSTANYNRSTFNVVIFVQVERHAIYYYKWATCTSWVMNLIWSYVQHYRFSWPMFTFGGSTLRYLQERSVQDDKFSFPTYLCYLVYAPLYIAGPIINFNAFASQVGGLDLFYLKHFLALSCSCITFLFLVSFVLIDFWSLLLDTECFHV